MDINYVHKRVDDLFPHKGEQYDAFMSMPESARVGFWLEAAMPVYANLNDSPLGFEAFYETIWHRALPEHCREWIKELYRTHLMDLNTLLEAFRGSTKSTFLATFIAFRIGHEPHKTNLIVSAGDKKANEMGEMVANKVIKDNPGWKLAFPNIIPDTEGHWGVDGGYDVVDTSIERGEWARKRGKEGSAPTLVAVSYSSKYLPGPHPTGVFAIDDIHDEENSKSDRQLRDVKTKVTGTMIPMLEPSTWHIIAGTPWTFSDVIAWAKTNKEYSQIYTPVYTEGEPTWTEKWNHARIEKRKREVNNDVEFARMYLLDLEKTRGLVLKKQWLEPYFNMDEVRADWKQWPAVMFIDYTSTENPMKDKTDYFGMAVFLLLPDNRRAVLVDGIYERVDHTDAQDMAVAKALEYPNLLVLGVEAIFAGKEYRNTLAQNAELIKAGIIPKVCRGGPWQQKKGNRFEKFLGPRFKKGTALIANSENQFVQAFKSEWVGWQGDAMADMGHDDALDAGFGALWLAQSYLTTGEMEFEGYVGNPLYPKKKSYWPKPEEAFSALGGRK